ncbi:alpha/beta-hydrolase [Cystobasidium minutum MCA 4210]|uniref:alpha/beta-hydrolase n=1 Tax=Cystobasidium minutum MCA 4210 TaxID=1397322 RepID=UPI0034CDF56A|eukprot:jgi/Rhomi1/31016/CE31015_1510
MMCWLIYRVLEQCITIALQTIHALVIESPRSSIELLLAMLCAVLHVSPYLPVLLVSVPTSFAIMDENTNEQSGLSTIFDAATCLRRGHCQVGKARLRQPHDIYYELHGQTESVHGPKATRVVYIMGLNNSCFGWHNQIKHFGKKEGYLSLVMDNRGVGHSDTPWGLYSTSEMAKDLIDLLDFLGWTGDKSLHVVGVSMGGMIAQELATVIPERIRSLALTSTTAGNTSEVAPVSALKMFAKLFFIRDPQEMVKLVINNLYPEEYLQAPDEKENKPTNRDRIVEEFLYRYDLTRRQTMTGRILQSVAAIGHKVSAERLKLIADQVSNIVIVTGDADQIINPDRSKDLHDMLPGSEYIVIPGGGHALPSQCTKEYNDLLERTFGKRT